jgi:hypothetical protein
MALRIHAVAARSGLETYLNPVASRHSHSQVIKPIGSGRARCGSRMLKREIDRLGLKPEIERRRRFLSGIPPPIRLARFARIASEGNGAVHSLGMPARPANSSAEAGADC